MNEVFFNACHPGLAYGDGDLKGPGVPGQAVKLSGDDEFTVCAAVTDAAVGLLGRIDLTEAQEVLGVLPASADLYKAVIWMNGGIFETVIFTAGIVAGVFVVFGIFAGVIEMLVTGTPDLQVIGKAISVAGGILKFKLDL